jgi:hypothetical protein
MVDILQRHKMEQKSKAERMERKRKSEEEIVKNGERTRMREVKESLTKGFRVCQVGEQKAEKSRIRRTKLSRH